MHPATWWVVAILVPIHIARRFLIDSSLWRAIGPGIMIFAV
ncbi:hypothetical protein P1X14_12050 [Sphingomonas sp. AOB5]|nr:hypothetical protein [Sphingomonas sp. AOB5]MDF7775981.1 hypothetical protein [Sphingomonas sp. AOB5]